MTLSPAGLVERRVPGRTPKTGCEYRGNVSVLCTHMFVIMGGNGAEYVIEEP